jgi:hypothetical protein
MKNLLITLFFLVTVNVFAQSFEGTMSWSMKMEITDPAKKAQMEEAQKMMQDPQKIKELEEQLNNPQMQQMMAQNPQMKAQMEKMLEMMKNGGGNLMPTGMVVKFKNGNSLSRLEGSFIDNDFLYLKEKNQTYTIDRKNKTYSVTAHSGSENDSLPQAKVTKTSEKIKVLNYTCTKYLVEYTINGKTMIQNVWATTEIKGLDISSMANQQMGGSKRMTFFKQIDGVPLKVDMSMPEGTMLMEATQIKRESLSSSDFTIPADYKEIKSSFLFGE